MSSRRSKDLQKQDKPRLSDKDIENAPDQAEGLLPGTIIEERFESYRDSFRMALNTLILLLVVAAVSLTAAFVIREIHHKRMLMYTTQPSGHVYSVPNYVIE